MLAHLLTSESRSCEPLISINDGNAVGGNVENNVEIKLFAVFVVILKIQRKKNKKISKKYYALPQIGLIIKFYSQFSGFLFQIAKEHTA